MSLRTLILAGLIAGASGAAHANLVVNPDFATSTPGAFPGYTSVDNWSTLASSGTTVTYNYGLSGSSSVGDVNTGTWWDNGYVPGQGTSGTVGFLQTPAGGGSVFFQQTVPVLAGHQYALSFYANVQFAGNVLGNTALVGSFIGTNSNGSAITLNSISNADLGDFSAPFTLEQGVFTATTNSEVLTIGDQAAPGVAVLFAGVTLVEVPEPATLALFGFGLGALGLVRRRA